MRKTIYSVVLVVAALSGSAYAGEMPQPGVTSSEVAVQGDIGQPLTEMILAALKTALSLI